MAPALAEVFTAAVNAIPDHQYDLREKSAWAPSRPDYDAWATRLNKLQPLVAIVGDQPVGFMDCQSDGLIDCAFVHPSFQGRGVANMLYQAVERFAMDRGITMLQVYASLAAKPFFNHKGFRTVEKCRPARQGVVLVNYLMIKELMESDRVKG